MCVVSMVTDHYTEKWYPLMPVQPIQPIAPLQPIQIIQQTPAISAEEVAEFRKLLERAREYDKRMNQPECAMDEKIAALKAIGKALGVDLSFLDNDASAPA